MNNSPGCVWVFDYDCTLTQPDDLSCRFLRGYLRELAELTGQPMEEIRCVANDVERLMRMHPEGYDWSFNGSIVSSTVGDPSLRFIGIVEEILRRYPPKQKILNLDDFKHQLFWRHYPHGTRLRAGAAQALTMHPQTFIVTNSPAARIERKVGRYGVRIVPEVGKQHIDFTFEEVPATLELSGLNRPVLLRRRRYHKVLTDILVFTGKDWSQMVVVGDNFELDLALPMAMGATGILVASRFTPPWEICYCRSHPQGAVVTSLRALRSQAVP